MVLAETTFSLAGLDPATHVLGGTGWQTWMAGSSPAKGFYSGRKCR